MWKTLNVVLARIFHSLRHRRDPLSAGGFYGGDRQGICGLMQNRPSGKRPCDRADLEKTEAQNSLKISPVSMQSFLGAVLPVARMCRPADQVRGTPSVCMQAIRVGCETSGLAEPFSDRGVDDIETASTRLAAGLGWRHGPAQERLRATVDHWDIHDSGHLPGYFVTAAPDGGPNR